MTTLFEKANLKRLAFFCDCEKGFFLKEMVLL